ncbi:MAG TPA: class I SAM-dependent methyltransferase [Candidatus Angelobacter sp.]|nr:class I SAM-dependent methyltransferase [Candidatus Angelobacter sp.]
MPETLNLDPKTVEGFGREWNAFTQTRLSEAERKELFDKYFSLIDWSQTPQRALDMGCGSGRWAVLAAPLVGELVAADASPVALAVARRNVQAPNVSFVHATSETLPFPEQYFDLIFSLGVLHHVPDTESAICSLGRKLRSGGTLLLYLYYAFDNRPRWFKMLWKMTDWVRRIISRLPFFLRYGLSQIIAVCVYWPLARVAKWFPVPDFWPLRIYADRSFYVMRTDALDRFGTRVEKRFTRKQIVTMLEAAGLQNVRFSDCEPYWVCVATKP